MNHVLEFWILMGQYALVIATWVFWLIVILGIALLGLSVILKVLFWEKPMRSCFKAALKFIFILPFTEQ